MRLGEEKKYSGVLTVPPRKLHRPSLSATRTPSPYKGAGEIRARETGFRHCSCLPLSGSLTVSLRLTLKRIHISRALFYILILYATTTPMDFLMNVLLTRTHMPQVPPVETVFFPFFTLYAFRFYYYYSSEFFSFLSLGIVVLLFFRPFKPPPPPSAQSSSSSPALLELVSIEFFLIPI